MASLSPIETYLSELPPHVVLTRSEQRALLVAAQRGRLARWHPHLSPEQRRQIDAGRVATERLIGAHLRLMIDLAKKLAAANQPYVSLEDLISAGHEGLLEALDRFDVHKDNLFWTFASSWVRNRMSKQIRASRWLVPIPESDFKDFLRIMTVRRRLRDTLSRVPQDSDVGRELGWPTDRVTRTIHRCTYLQRVESLDRPIPGTNIPLGHIVASSPRESDDVADEVFASMLRENMAWILRERLTRDELTVISARHATLDEPMSYRTLATNLGVSPERVRQIERAATRKLASSGLGRYLDDEKANEDCDDEDDLAPLGRALIEALRDAGQDPSDLLLSRNSA